MPEILNYTGDGLRITLSKEVVTTLKKYAQTDSNQFEACGILIGSTSKCFKEVYVDSITEPRSQDRRGRTFFTLKDKGHQQSVNKAFKESDGVQRLVGSWHTHPEKHPSPSKTDHTGWNTLIKRNQDFTSFVFIIVGTKEISLFVKKDKKFVQINPEICHEKLPHYYRSS